MVKDESAIKLARDAVTKAEGDVVSRLLTLGGDNTSETSTEQIVSINSLDP